MNGTLTVQYFQGIISCLFVLFSLGRLADFVNAGGVALRKRCRDSSSATIFVSMLVLVFCCKGQLCCQDDCASAVIDGLAEIDPTVSMNSPKNQAIGLLQAVRYLKGTTTSASH